MTLGGESSQASVLVVVSHFFVSLLSLEEGITSVVQCGLLQFTLPQPAWGAPRMVNVGVRVHKKNIAFIPSTKKEEEFANVVIL
jgi:hypothetical protein